MRDSFAASESVELAPNGVAGFRRNGWPDWVGMGGRLPSERGRIASESVAGLARFTHLGASDLRYGGPNQSPGPDAPLPRKGLAGPCPLRNGWCSQADLTDGRRPER